MSAVWTIARRELRALFDHPTGYILLVVFIGLNNFFFFRQAYLTNVASLRPMMELLPWMFLFFVPAVTMRALAEDLRGGTIEVVLAQPITEAEWLAGKYVGQLLFIWIALAITILIPMGLGIGADMQVGVLFAQYVGAALLAAGFTAVGMWASSLGKNQITAFIVGVAVMFLFMLVGFNQMVLGLPPALAAIAANLGVLSHFSNIARGVIDLRDAVYFITLAGVFLVLAYGVLMGRKLAPKGDALKRLRLGTLLLVITLVVVNLFGRHIGGRLDLTPGKAYTLSRPSKEILGDLNDLVTIKLFVSRELPPEIKLLKRDIDDLLSDIRGAAGGKVRVVEVDPAKDQDAGAEAQSLGIPPVQFNVVGQSELKVKEGYLGLAVQYADESETIPLVQRTDDLEYRLVSDIRSLTRENEPVIGFVEQQPLAMPGQPPPQGPGYTALRRQLEQVYKVRTVSLATDALVPGDLSVLVLAGSPMFLEDSVAKKVEDYLIGGGSALVMASGMQLSPEPQQPFARSVPVTWNKVLEPYGVSVDDDMVYDLLANEQVGVPASFGRIYVRYPFWLKALSTRNTSINQDIETVFLPWTSQIDTSKAIPGTVTPLLATSNGAGVENGSAFIDPRRSASDFAQDSLRSRLVAVMVNPTAAEAAPPSDDSEGESETPAPPRGRVIVVGNGEFASDQWVNGAASNLVFVANAVDWLAQDEALISIRSKDRSPPPLVFESSAARDVVQYGNLIGVPIFIVLAAVLRWLQRGQTRQRKYVAPGASEAP